MHNYRRRSMFGSYLPASAVAAAVCAAGLWTAGSTVLQAQAREKTIYVSVLDRNKKPVETLQPEDITIRDCRIHGSLLRPRPLEDKAAAARAVERHVLPLLATGAVTVPIAATFPLAEATAAYEHFAAGGKLGKIVLTSDGV